MSTKLSLLTMIFLGVLFASQRLVAMDIRLATQPVGSTLTIKGEPYINCAMAKLNQSFTINYMPFLWRHKIKIAMPMRRFPILSL